jgi:hypothetical protein
VAFGDNFIWAEAISGEAASRIARTAVEQIRSARIGEILAETESARHRSGFWRSVEAQARLRKKEGRPEAAFATL